MTDAKYKDRQKLEVFCWPELMQIFKGLIELIMVTPAISPASFAASSLQWQASPAAVSTARRMAHTRCI
jgi:hypothetical protein